MLYGYTYDTGRIRPSLITTENINEDNTRYMLVSCPTF